jgi:hypothetical protein
LIAALPHAQQSVAATQSQTPFQHPEVSPARQAAAIAETFAIALTKAYEQYGGEQ